VIRAAPQGLQTTPPVATGLRGLESSDALRAWGGTQSCRDGPIHFVARNAKLLQCDVAIDWQEGALFGFCPNIKKQGPPKPTAPPKDNFSLAFMPNQCSFRK